MLNDNPQNGTMRQVAPTWLERHGIPPFIFAFLALVIIFFLYQVVGGLITFFLFGMKPLEEHLSGYRMVTALGQLLFILVPTFLLVRLASNRPNDYLRIHPSKLKTLLMSVIGIVSLQPMLQIYLIFQDKIPLPPEIQSTVEKFRDLFNTLYLQLAGATSLTELSSVIFIIAIIPAFAEEFMFRGLIQRALEKSLTPMAGVLFTGIIFAAYHLNPFSFIPLVAIGIYLGFLVMRSESIWVPITAHFINNAIACVTLYFNLEDDYVIVGNAGDMSNAWLLATFWLFGLIFLLSTMYFIKITKKSNQPTEQSVNTDQESEYKDEQSS
jgi:membrane protease YdiL (CAAX protease family)